jgi:hypothetical protein
MRTIKNKLTQLLLTASLIFLIAACSPNPEFELYEGKELSIAVLGTKPEVEEEQVDFQEITFDEFTTEVLNKFDAVFIMKENLEEAAESQYAPIYSDTHIPFFFIENNKDEYPFIDADLAYEDAMEIPDHNYYATSFLKTPDDEERTVRYGLYNDEVSEENIQEAFSRMFKAVEQSSGD